MGTRFDFTAAENLCTAVNRAADLMDAKNTELDSRFKKLHEFFKDDAYENFSADMAAADRAVNQVVQQMRDTAAHIGQYAQVLKDSY